MIKYGDNDIGRMILGSNEIGKAYLGSNLVFQKGTPPSAPYTRVEYIQTDGDAFINTRILGNNPRCVMTKFLITQNDGFVVVVGSKQYAEPDTKLFNPITVNLSGAIGLAYNYYYNSDINISDSITNGTPVIALSKLAVRQSNTDQQELLVRQSEEGLFSSYETTSITSVNSDSPLYLFAGASGVYDGTAVSNMPSGSRIYYCRIYDDRDFKSLVFDGIPVLYRGKYGLWDNVTRSFYGNAGESGAFSGPSTPYGQYIPVEYIETDGSAYINTKVTGADISSAEIKFTPVSASGVILGTTDGGENSTTYVPFMISTSGVLTFGHTYFYVTGAPSVANSIANSTPFEAKVSMRNGEQSLSVKQAGESEYTTFSKTQSATLNTGESMYLFACSRPVSHESGNHVANGSRLYYCKVYQRLPYYRFLSFDGVPCYYNGEYGLWDRVSETFFGNANSTGAFSGPTI